jgi:hypothetical protein
VDLISFDCFVFEFFVRFQDASGIDVFPVGELLQYTHPAPIERRST